MKLTKTLTYVLALLIYTLLVLHSQPETDLEIYTTNDIYYIKGLTITRENSNEGYIFNTPSDLKVFIAELTSKQIK